MRMVGTLYGLFHQRFGQAGLGDAGFAEAGAQVGAEAAELFNAGDDAGLFGEGRNWKWLRFEVHTGYPFLSGRTCHYSFTVMNEIR
jgi:hypothetical protein